MANKDKGRGRSDAAGVVHLGDGLAQRQSPRHAPVGLDREGEDRGEPHGPSPAAVLTA